MNFSAKSRKFLRIPAKPVRPSSAPPTIEPLESRIAPATLVSPTTVTYTDKNGDAATVTISQPLFTAASVAKVFTFDTGSVNGDNSVHQQLELLDIAKLGRHAARGLDISITSVPVSGSPGIVDVGYINASDIDLGNVNVGGDLGRINAGDFNYSTPGLGSLTVESLGAHGVTTQIHGGNLISNIAGSVGSITVNGNIDGASIGIGGGKKGTLGSLAVTGLTVTGSIEGGAGAFSGSVRTQGAIFGVVVDGSIIGGHGADSGIIGTAGTIGSVIVDGSVTGGAGAFSGAILSTRSMGPVTIDGNLTGGSGDDSGQVGTSSNLGTFLAGVTVGGSVTGGHGKLSGAILATGYIGSVTIDGNLTGGAGAGSGQIGSAASIGPVIIEGSMTAGAEIKAHFDIESISVNVGGPAMALSTAVEPVGSFTPGNGPGIVDGTIKAFDGSIGSIVTGGSGSSTSYAMFDSFITAGANIGPIEAVTTDETTIGVIFCTDITAGGSLGDITVSSSDGTGIRASHFLAADGIGNITVDATIPNLISYVRAHPLVSSDLYPPGDTEGIYNSTFVTGGSIGDISVSLSGMRNGTDNSAISSTAFQAGHAIGTITVATNLCGTGGNSYGIVNTTIDAGLKGNGGVGDISVTLSNSGSGGNSAAIANTKVDASVHSGTAANIGSIYVDNAGSTSTDAGILNSIFRTHGNIGSITADLNNESPTTPAIGGTTFSAYGSIGDIYAEGAVLAGTSGPSRFLAGYDIGSSLAFAKVDLGAKSLALQAGQSIGNVTVTGYFEGSDIIASVNPGAGYVFGDSANKNVGTGGSIGFVDLATSISVDSTPFTFNQVATHGIEAASFALGEGTSPDVFAFGYGTGIPVDLKADGVDGASGYILITNFTPEST